MTYGPGKFRWLVYATEEDLARLAPPERVAGIVSPMIVETVRIFGGLPSIPTLTAIIAEAIARSPVMQELDLADIEPENGLELAELAPGYERGAEEMPGGERMKDKFIDSTGDPRREALVRRVEEAHPDVPVRELTFAMRQERLRRELAKLEERLEEQDL
jgi:hypothetical protein